MGSLNVTNVRRKRILLLWSTLAEATTSIIFVATKHVSCRDKCMFVAISIFLSRGKKFMTNAVLSRQKLCHDKLTFVVTSTCLPRQNTSFVATKVSLAGAATSIIFVATNTCLLWQTRLLSRRKYAYRDKTFVTTNIFVAANILLREIFVVTNIILTWQNVCRDKLTFVATNTSFVATNILSRWAKK